MTDAMVIDLRTSSFGLRHSVFVIRFSSFDIPPDCASADFSRISEISVIRRLPRTVACD